MISFRSIFSRIIFLHVIALVITAIFMPLVLYYFFKWAANDLHDQAMREQAELVAHYLVLRPDDSWTLDLPPALHDVYSQAVGRYAYAVLDDGGRSCSPRSRTARRYFLRIRVPPMSPTWRHDAAMRPSPASAS